MYILGSEDRIPSENVSCFFLFSHKECYRFSRLACENGTHLHDFEKRAVFDKFDKVWVYIPENS